MLDLRARGKKARSLVLNTPFPPELEAAISSAYLRLCDRYNATDETCENYEGDAADECRTVSSDLDVAVRSSATAEDLPDASFCRSAGNLPQRPRGEGRAGSLPQVLRFPVHRPGDLLTATSMPSASTGLTSSPSPCPWVCKRWCALDLASSGVMFSIDTETGF